MDEYKFERFIRQFKLCREDQVHLENECCQQADKTEFASWKLRKTVDKIDPEFDPGDGTVAVWSSVNL
jgi:hypothetical protein